MNLITTKHCVAIMHDEVPSKLLQHSNPLKRKASTGDGKEADSHTEDKSGTDNGKCQKKQLNHPHSKELEDFQEPNEAAGTSSLKHICKYCGVMLEQLVPDLGPTDCCNVLFIGKCMFGETCKFNHCTATKK